MMEMMAAGSVAEGHKTAHQTYPADLAAMGRVASEYSVSPFPSRDAWGTELRYRISPDGHYFLTSAGADRVFEPERVRTSDADWRSSVEFNDPGGDIVYGGGDGVFLQSPRGLAGALGQVTWLDNVELPLRVEPAGNLTVMRGQKVSFEVIVTAPRDDVDVEEPQVPATNLAKDYFSQHPSPNLFLSVVRLDAPISTAPLRLRIQTSGSGGSQREHFRSINFDLMASEEERQKRLHEAILRILRLKGIAPTDPIMQAKFTKSLDDYYYISNPPGTYDLAIEYKPAGGAWKDHPLIHHIRLVVTDGPDSLETMLSALK
jgi:hypothetical protein